MDFKFKMLNIALFLVFSVTGVLFAQTDNLLNGRWVTIQDNLTLEYRFNNGNFEDSMNGIISHRGTYTINNGNIYLNYTHIHGASMNELLNEIGVAPLDSKWYTMNEFIIAFRPILLGLEFSNEDVNDLIHEILILDASYSYSVDTTTLILTSTVGRERIVLIFNKR